MTDRYVDILLVQRDHRRGERVLDVLRRLRLADRVHVLRDGDELLELLGGAASAHRRFARPRLVLFDAGACDTRDMAALVIIAGDPRVANLPVTVLADNEEARSAATSALRRRGLSMPVVALERLELNLHHIDALDTSETDVLEEDGGWFVTGAAEPHRVREAASTPVSPGASAERLIEADADLTRLAHAAAHELNNVLSVVAAYTDLLFKEMELDDPRRAGADDICKLIDRASRLARDLLTFGPRCATPTPDSSLRTAGRETSPAPGSPPHTPS